VASLLLGILLTTNAAVAQDRDCPKEPTQTTITTGEVFSGANCTLNAVGDIDSFVFSGTAGQTYQIGLGLVSAINSNICLALYDPNGHSIFSGCTAYNFGANAAVVVDQALTLTGSYQMNVTESTSATQGYAVSLERLYPFPPNAVSVTTFGSAYNGDIAEPTDTNAFVFNGQTTSTYEVTATLTGSILANICMAVYAPNGTLVTPSMGTVNPGCTAYNFGANASVVVDFTPAQAGQYLEFIQASGDDNTQTYTLEVSCLLGNGCSNTSPPCTLKNTPTYNATNGTLTMDFTVGNDVATTWNAWLTSQNNITQLFSVAQPITVPPVPITKTTTVSPTGTVGVLSTLTTPTRGIFCSSYVQVSTGNP
jgi:hypothetical protein